MFLPLKYTQIAVDHEMVGKTLSLQINTSVEIYISSISILQVFLKLLI